MKAVSLLFLFCSIVGRKINQNLAAAAARNSLALNFGRTVALSGSGLNFFGVINLNYYYQIWVCVRRGMGAIGKPPKEAILNKLRFNARTSSHNGLRKKSSARGKGQPSRAGHAPLSKQSTGLF